MARKTAPAEPVEADPPDTQAAPERTETIAESYRAESKAPAAPETPAQPAPSHTDGQQPAAQQQAQNQFLEALKQRGFNLGDVADDNAAFTALQRLQQEREQYAQTLQQIQPHYQQLVSNYDKWQAFLQGQQQQAPAQPGQQKNFWEPYWKPPEWNPAWEQLITKDAQGNLIPVPGAPPNVVQKYQEYITYQAQEMQKFRSNPHEYMRPTVENLAAEIARKEIEKHLGGFKDQQFAQQFTSQNAGWLYQRDQQGNLLQNQVFNPMTGMMEQRPALSEWGQMLLHGVQGEAARQQQRGYQDVQEQQRNAMKDVQLQYAVSTLNQIMTELKKRGIDLSQPAAGGAPAAPAQTPREQANAAFEARAANGQVPRGRPIRNQSEPPQAGKSLKQEMFDELRAAGVTSFGGKT